MLRLISQFRRHSWVWRAATTVALLAQCWIAAAPLAETRGFGASAHVEADGTAQHYGHDEASCAACSVIALVLAVPPRGDLSTIGSLRSELVAAPLRGLAPGAPRLSNNSRAPPSAL